MAVQRLGKVAEYKILSTGTAVTKKKRVFDLYSQWKFMKPDSPLIAEHTSLSFKKKYGVWIDKNGYPQWLGERNQKTLHRLVHADSFAVTRDECFDLPANFPPQIIHVPLEESRKVYIDMAEEMIAKIKTGEITEASIKLVLNLRLCQITSGIARTAPSEKYPKGRLVRIGQEKLRILDDLFEDWFEQEEKLVVCARFRADLASISKLAREHKVVPQLIYGGQKRRDRTKNIETFRNRSGLDLPVSGSRVIIAQRGSRSRMETTALDPMRSDRPTNAIEDKRAIRENAKIISNIGAVVQRQVDF